MCPLKCVCVCVCVCVFLCEYEYVSCELKHVLCNVCVCVCVCVCVSCFSRAVVMFISMHVSCHLVLALVSATISAGRAFGGFPDSTSVLGEHRRSPRGCHGDRGDHGEGWAFRVAQWRQERHTDVGAEAGDLAVHWSLCCCPGTEADEGHSAPDPVGSGGWNYDREEDGHGVRVDEPIRRCRVRRNPRQRGRLEGHRAPAEEAEEAAEQHAEGDGVQQQQQHVKHHVESTTIVRHAVAAVGHDANDVPAGDAADEHDVPDADGGMSK